MLYVNKRENIGVANIEKNNFGKHFPFTRIINFYSKSETPPYRNERLLFIFKNIFWDISYRPRFKVKFITIDNIIQNK